MRAFEFLIESPQVASLQKALIDKIQQLPADDSTLKALKEIEDLLNTVGAGGRMGMVNNQLEEIGDEDVTKARKLLAKYVLSIDADPAEKKAMMAAWKADKLIDIKSLMSPVYHKITDVVIGYDSNPAIQQLTDDLVEIAALGQGKGEFMLSVMSKRVMKKQKGDLVIDGKNIELKTSDGGAGRFYDQEVRPNTNWPTLSENYLNTYKEEIDAAGLKVPGTGMKIDMISKVAEVMPSEKVEQHKKDLNDIFKAIFPTQDVGSAVEAALAGNVGEAKQRFARLSLDNYLSIKDDDAVLMIDLNTKPISLAIFSSAADLYGAGLRLHAGTIYPIATDARYAYPQVKIAKTAQAQPD